MINHEDLMKMDYLDEKYSPQDMDDHDLMFRMRKKLKKVCGSYSIDFESDPSWGGTRKETGEPALGYTRPTIRIVRSSTRETRTLLRSLELLKTGVCQSNEEVTSHWGSRVHWFPPC